LCAKLGDKRGLAIDLESASAFALRRSDHRTCARLLGAADAHRDRTGAAREPMVAKRIESVAAAAATALGDDGWRVENDAGRSMSLEEAVTEAEALLGAPAIETDAAHIVHPPDVPLAIQTFGGFAVFIRGEPVPATAWQSRKARDLIKILISRRGRPVPRDTLIELLWPQTEDEPSRLRSRLSVVLSTVRSVFGGVDGLLADRDAVAIDLEAVSVDVERFLRSIAQGDLDSAETLYTGEFLPEDVYADWAVGLREEARLAFVSAARNLAKRRADDGDDEAVIALSSRILDQDPYDNEAHCYLIRGLAGAGRHGDARRAHELFERRMAELGLTPPAFEALSSG
jgi:DNA-binding SARP family transcriptional activator